MEMNDVHLLQLRCCFHSLLYFFYLLEIPSVMNRLIYIPFIYFRHSNPDFVIV